MKEFSTFADGRDCHECESLLKENNNLRKKVIEVLAKTGAEIAALKLKIKQLECPHSVDVLGVCEWCGAGARPEHLGKDQTKP